MGNKQGSRRDLKLSCGNQKLMKRTGVFQKEQDKDSSNLINLQQNVDYLEQEGKTVVVMAIDGVP